MKSQFYLRFWRSNLISCERVARDDLGIAILRQFLAIDRAKGLRRTTCKSQFFRSFWRSNLISCERVAPDKLTSQFYFRSNFISCERVAFRAVSLALPLPPPSREIEHRRRGQEGKRARGQEGKRARGQEGKRARGQEGKRARGQEGKRARCEDEKM